MSERNPMQPLVRDNRGVVRFRPNKIVQFFVDQGPSLNDIPNGFTQDDWEQFYQLIGYSLSGFHELSNVSDETALIASAACKRQFGRREEKTGCRADGCGIHVGVERA